MARIMTSLMASACACLSSSWHPALADQLEAAVVVDTVYPGQAIAQGTVTMLDISGCTKCASGYVTDAKLLAGMVAVRTILPNLPIYPELLRPPVAIKGGQQVTVIYRIGQLSISMRGDSLADASAGESVAVRNKSNGSSVTGIAQLDGTVIVGPS